MKVIIGSSYIVVFSTVLLCQCYKFGNANNKDSDEFEQSDNKSSETDKNILRNSILKSKLDFLGETLKANINVLKKHEKIDLVFLIDGSSTVGEQNFRSELKFVKKILSDISVDYDEARIAIVTFSSKNNVVKNVDQITRPVRENNKCLFLNKEINEIEFPGGGTYTLGAFQLAKKIFERSRNDSKKVLFLVTDGFSNGGDPVPVANKLKGKNVTIFTIGVKHGNYKELYELSSSSQENLYSYLVDSFGQFESLARRALHVDIEGGQFVPLGSETPCNSLCSEGKHCCDEKAICTCGTLTGHYTCLCEPGYYGSGFKNSCNLCPPGSYSDGPNECVPCPDINHFSDPPAVGIESCKCESGYKRTKDNRCEVVKCPKLKPPLHGYFVKSKECGETLNNACGIRCEVGYVLSGNSIRLCQKNASWSGQEPACRVKTCSALPQPKDGSVRCYNVDIGISYDGMETRYPVDTICKFECDKGRLLIGSPFRTCLPIAQWDGLPTSCKKVSCNKLSEIPHGRIEPSSCLKTKQSYGKTCRYFCDEGFEIVGPKEITCTGKSWNKKKQPTICKDNSGMDVKIWLHPAIRQTKNVKFRIGTTTLTYFAEDVFKNKANCTFSVEITDNEPPQIENCIDPPTFLTTKERVNISWDEPNIIDNSGKVTVTKSHEFGIFAIGTTQVVYTATDPYGNTNACTLNITVQESRCEPLPSPENGKSICESSKSSYSSGMQCIVTCEDGYALPMSSLSDSLDSLDISQLLCSDDDPLYYYSMDSIGFPECTITAIPSDAMLEGVITLEEEEEEDTEDTCQEDDLNEMKNDIQTNLAALTKSNNVSAKILCEEEVEISEEEEKSNMIKREAPPKTKRKKHKKKKRKMKVQFQVNIAANFSQHNLGEIDKRLKNIKTIGGKQINVVGVNADKKIKCPIGYMRKKHKCAKCPLGTFNNATKSSCQNCPLGTYSDNLGQISCAECPPYYSTRKLRSKSTSECKAHCPPGTIAKRKIVKISKRHPNSAIDHVTLMPFCRSCPIGYYQPGYGKVECISCPQYFTTNSVQADSFDKCVPTPTHICVSDPYICNGGECITTSEFHYYCRCPNNTIGSNCEKKISICDSNPCLNDGHCLPSTEESKEGYICDCPEGYSGVNCEEIEESCRRVCYNNGTCFSTEDDEQMCLCPAGYGGDSCEIPLRYCREGICENNGTCVEEPYKYKCICKEGFLGKRCHILPCDYRPCKSNKICINIMERNASPQSYRCVCPEGFEGEDCTRRINYCYPNPCLNNGTCISVRNSYRCNCGRVYTGPICETKMESNYIMHFQYPVTTAYVRLNGFDKSLTEVSVSLWIMTSDAFNYGTLFSYATRNSDNAFTAMDYSGLVLYVNNQVAVTDVHLNDGIWHFLCVSWNKGSYKVYVDGINIKSGDNLAEGSQIEAGGIMIIGQEQDAFGGKFSQTQAFVGKITSLDFWSKELTAEEIVNIMNSCDEDIYGDLYSWAEMKYYIRGDIKIEESKFCTNCPKPPPLLNGDTEIKSNRVFYKCNSGFIFQPKEYSLGRKCLKSQQWEGEINPVCKRVYCGYPGYLQNGYMTGKRFSYGDKVTFHCYNGYDLSGTAVSACTENGSWKPGMPYCIGKNDCRDIEKPENAVLTIISEESFEITERKSFEPGVKIEITCSNNTILEGNSILTCLETGFWDHAPPNCTAPSRPVVSRTCSVDDIPHAPSNGYIVPESLNAFNDGSSKDIFYKCRHGYIMVGNNVTTCITDGYWSQVNMSCQPVECSPPPVFPKMHLKFSNVSTFVFGNVISYECQEGYKVFGNNVIRCLATKKWTRMQGKCIKISCYKPVISDATTVEGNSFLFEDQVTLICPSGNEYQLTCSSSGKWVGDKGSDC